jgi:uncharacterized protein YggE
VRKKILLFLITILIIIAIGMTGCEGITSPTRSTTTGEASGGQNTGIWVSGTGEVTVTPDIAILEVGAEAQEATVAEAMAEASQAMNNILTSLTSSGIESKDIQTRHFNIQQRTKWDSFTDEEKVTGYRVANKLTVKIRLLPIDSYTLDYKASNVIDAVVKAGGDLIRIDNFSFSVEDPTKYYDEAREKATKDAEAKAEKLADQMGVRLGDPTFVSESAYIPSTYGGMTYELSVPTPAPVAIQTVPTTSAGELKIVLTVQVAYSIR